MERIVCLLKLTNGYTFTLQQHEKSILNFQAQEQLAVLSFPHSLNGEIFRYRLRVQENKVLHPLLVIQHKPKTTQRSYIFDV